MPKRFLPVFEPDLGDREERYLVECIRSGWISSTGPFVRRFEQAVADRVGRKHGIAVCNGSAALRLALVALNLSPGDEVIVPTLTIISCITAILDVGARPVFVDVRPDTWNMCVDEIEARVGPRTKAIMVVHLYGLPANMVPIEAIAKRHDLTIIEDAAQAIGHYCSGRACGAFGAISALSFYSNKNVATGEGGMVLTNQDDIAELCRSMRNLCFGRPRFVHDEIGWNFRMTNMQAAIGLAQLEGLSDRLAKKVRLADKYRSRLSDHSEIQLPLHKTDYATNSYWVFGIVLGDQFRSADLIEYLSRHGIGARPFFWPMHEQPVFKKLGLFSGERYPVSEQLARRGLYLPSGVGLDDSSVERVTQSIAAWLKLAKSST